MAFMTGLLVMFIFFFRARTRVASLSFPLAQYQSVSTNVTCSSKNAESDQEHREKERKNIHSCCLSHLAPWPVRRERERLESSRGGRQTTRDGHTHVDAAPPRCASYSRVIICSASFIATFASPHAMGSCTTSFTLPL